MQQVQAQTQVQEGSVLLLMGQVYLLQALGPGLQA
jgi:hypothetical protein